MKVLIIGVSIASGMKEVLLRVQDQTPFVVGQEFDLSLTPIETAQPLPPDNVVAMAPDTTGTPPADLKAQGDTGTPLTMVAASDEIGTKPIIDKPTSDNACKQCFGTGVVSMFVNGESTGKTDICQRCNGKGIEPATA